MTEVTPEKSSNSWVSHTRRSSSGYRSGNKNTGFFVFSLLGIYNPLAGFQSPAVWHNMFLLLESWVGLRSKVFSLFYLDSCLTKLARRTDWGCWGEKIQLDFGSAPWTSYQWGPLTPLRAARKKTSTHLFSANYRGPTCRGMFGFLLASTQGAKPRHHQDGMIFLGGGRDQQILISLHLPLIIGFDIPTFDPLLWSSAVLSYRWS